MSFRLGKQAASYDRRDLTYADVRPSGLSLPAAAAPSRGYGMDFADWLMLGNGPCDDGSVNETWPAFHGAGDCAWAGPAHETMEAHKNAGTPIPQFTCLNVLEQYSAYSGYNLQTGANDNGSQVRDVLKWRQTKGLVDATGTVHKIGTFVSVEAGSTTQLAEALWLFEAVGIGIHFPDSAMDQFQAGKMWSVVAGGQVEGGHYIPLVGHPIEDVWTCVTWGKAQTMTASFLKTYCDEAWAYVNPESYNQVTGEDLQNFTEADLEKYITLFSRKLAAKQ